MYIAEKLMTSVSCQEKPFFKKKKKRIYMYELVVLDVSF